ncbi:MAG TPA: NADH-quinone oxidoreductase subunit C [Anaerolineae bacterium]
MDQQVISNLGSTVLAELGDAVSGTQTFRDEVTLFCLRERVVEVLKYLRDAQKFDMLTDETCVDYYPNQPRFGIIYQLNSTTRNIRVRVKVMLSENDRSIASACGVYRAANWLEREIYDLFGITFAGHPDLRRIMMPPGWEGHPLLKENPAKVEEVAFSFNRERVDANKPHAQE